MLFAMTSALCNITSTGIGECVVVNVTSADMCLCIMVVVIFVRHTCVVSVMITQNIDVRVGMAVERGAIVPIVIVCAFAVQCFRLVLTSC